MLETTSKSVNVASKESTSGHFANGAKRVVMLDEINETRMIEGDCVLSTKNHTDLNMKSDCLITIQNVYDPFIKMFHKSRD
ncbi:Uncharacterised protein [Sphingobacterium spiritivorum]|uniref:Uncharacterized protein n=1 Tax=Sphingobacterium spiritivorum TaxID=258 RepID=A0A380CGH8_SPHSI|nr:Uncharacterised protein [Sphingobacterium spiritivorum]